MGGSSSSTPTAPSYNTPQGYATGPIYAESAGEYPVRQFALSLGGVPSYQTQMIQRPQIMNMEGYSRRHPYGDFGTGYDAFQRYQNMADFENYFAKSPEMGQAIYPFLGGLMSTYGATEQTNPAQDLANYYSQV